MTDIIIVHTASIFATAAHYAIDQRRKYTGEPYIGHPARVVELVKTVDHTPEMLCAAWLHDVVEDTKVPLDILDKLFGGTVANMVFSLTDCGHECGNRAKRKAIDRERLAQAPGSVQTIKVADLIDNTSTIVQFDPEFAKVYLREKRELLDVLSHADPFLWTKADDMLKTAVGLMPA
jgi:(p)ppGpp synthase/HD superfamily hydrolase